MTQVEVAVIGAGAAGLGAAAMLAAAGTEVLLLEARDRIGGRAHTDLSVPEAPFDRGASYLHAVDQGNPWLSIAAAWREPLVLDLRHRTVLAQGRPLAPAPYQAAVQAAWRRLAAAPSAGPLATSAGAVLPAQSAADHYARALVGPWLSGTDVDEVDAADFAAARDGEDWLVPGGYGRLVERFGTGLPIRCGCPVTSVRTLAGGVELTTPAGKLRAQRAVVTVPLGVLAAGAIAFDPSLASTMLAALDALPMGNLVKLRVRLAGDPLGCGDMIYATAPPTSERAVLWLVRPFGRAELMGFAGGSLGRELAALSPPDLVAAIRGELAALAGSAAADAVADCQLADWAADPWALGSYAIARPGASAARAALRVPWSERVHYAGEAAAADGWHGTVAGALLSGIAAARAILADLGPPSPSSSSRLFAPRAPRRSDLGSGE
jgi:monoamine oxidase